MLRTLHLFAGAGGGLLADLILGHNPIGAVEWDHNCCDLLRRHAADGWFPDLRVHEGDVRMFDPSEYTLRVDIIHAGFPCQDLSCAGDQAGLGEGTRSGLYREVLRIADIVRPRFLFMENVSAILTNRFLGTVLGDLAARGYDARWTCLPASAAGAPHFRDRWWCLAFHPDGERETSVREFSEKSHTESVGTGHASNFDSTRQLQPERREKEQRGWIGDTVEKNVAHPVRLGIEGEQPSSINTAGWKITGERPTRSCGDGGGWGSTPPGLDGVDDGMADGLDRAWWETEPDVGRVAEVVKNRGARIKCLGNGQVPIQGALAWRLLGGP